MPTPPMPSRASTIVVFNPKRTSLRNPGCCQSGGPFGLGGFGGFTGFGSDSRRNRVLGGVRRRGSGSGSRVSSRRGSTGRGRGVRTSGGGGGGGGRRSSRRVST